MGATDGSRLRRAVIAARRREMVRIKSQCAREGIENAEEEMTAETQFAKNTMIVTDGSAPYNALMGRAPRMLRDFEAPGRAATHDNSGPVASNRHAARGREISYRKRDGRRHGKTSETSQRHQS
jgi:hypothetical protein